jgi:hypothetical protein
MWPTPGFARGYYLSALRALHRWRCRLNGSEKWDTRTAGQHPNYLSIVSLTSMRPFDSTVIILCTGLYPVRVIVTS